MAPTLVRPLVNLRSQLNDVAPGRDKSSDGWIGDYAHSQGTSGHNPDDTSRNNAEWDGDADSIQDVRAVDLDEDLRTPGLSMAEICRHLVQGARSGRFWFIRYIIYEGVIYHKNTGYAARNYTGSNPHDHHMHVSSGWSESADDANPDYGFEELLDMAEVDLSASAKAFIEAATANAGEVWAAEVNPGDGRRSLATVVVDMYNIAKSAKEAQVSNSQAILAAVQAIGASGGSPIDIQALATIIAPQVTAGVVAAMPDLDGATPAEVQDRVEIGVRNVLGSLA